MSGMETLSVSGVRPFAGKGRLGWMAIVNNWQIIGANECWYEGNNTHSHARNALVSTWKQVYHGATTARKQHVRLHGRVQ